MSRFSYILIHLKQGNMVNKKHTENKEINVVTEPEPLNPKIKTK